MMDCKNALVEANGNFDEAIAVLRKKGQKVAANRADRESSEGVVLAKVSDDNTYGIIVSLNCETDFVAKNEDYIGLAQSLADHALNFTDKDSFLNSDFDGMKVSDKLLEQTGVIGEKIEIGSFEYGVSQDIIEKEIEIAKDQLRQEGKPEEMLDNIAKGKLKKFFKENTLVNQQFIKDSKQSISDYLKSQSENAEVTGFSRVGLV